MPQAAGGQAGGAAPVASVRARPEFRAIGNSRDGTMKVRADKTPRQVAQQARRIQDNARKYGTFGIANRRAYRVGQFAVRMSAYGPASEGARKRAIKFSNLAQRNTKNLARASRLRSLANKARYGTGSRMPLEGTGRLIRFKSKKRSR